MSVGSVSASQRRRRPTNAPFNETIDPDTTLLSSPHTSPGIAQATSRVESRSAFGASRSIQVPYQVCEQSAVSQSSAISVQFGDDHNREQRPRSRSSVSSQPQRQLPSASDDEDLSTPSKSSPSNRLPPLSPPTQRQHAQLQSVQIAVNIEKRRFNKSDDRNVHLTQVRRLLKEVFQAPTDKDFYNTHVAAPREEVDQYLDGVGHGPDTANLHFTDQEPFNNAWNSAVCSHLARTLWDRQGTEQWMTKKGKRAANASEAYWEDAIQQKFRGGRKGWVDARQKVVHDPTTGRNRVEYLEEAEARRFSKGEETRTAARQRERRLKVRWMHH